VALSPGIPSPTRTLQFLEGRSSLGDRVESPDAAPYSSLSSPGRQSQPSEREDESDDEGDTEEERETSMDASGADFGGYDDDTFEDAGDDPGSASDTDRQRSSLVDEYEEDEEQSAAVVTDVDLNDDESLGRGREGDASGRRSRRNRYPPLQYWKNERYVFERPQTGVGEVLPIVAGVSERTKTPVPPQRQQERGRKRGGADLDPIDLSSLPSDRSIKKSDKAKVWHDKEKCPRKIKIVCRAETMTDTERELPITAERSRSENSLVGSASQVRASGGLHGPVRILSCELVTHAGAPLSLLRR